MHNVIVVDHPFVQDSLTHLRDKNSHLTKFRRHSDQLCRFLFAEAIRGLEFSSQEIETPLATTIAPKMKDEIVVVPVLRSGLAMLFGAMQLLPKSKIGFAGLERDESTAIAGEYYYKMPQITKHSVVVVTDPMLATGGTLEYLLKRVAPLEPKELRIVCVVAAPEGIERIHSLYPDIKIFTAAIDSHLNDKKYIVPGLGDYGDRYFGTE